MIPAAGKGNRINDLPLTRILPKPMLPILNKPILEHVIDNMKKLGVEVVYMIVSHKKSVIKEYFGNGKDWDIEIDYIEQKNPRGAAHAISLAENYVSDPFCAILGDDLTIASSLDNLAETFWKNDAWAVEGVALENDVEVLKRTCSVSLEKDGRIKEIIEKPTEPSSKLRGIGVYLFQPIVFEFIRRTPLSPKRDEREITDTIGLIAREGKAYGVLIDGANSNINTLMDLLRATKTLLKNW